MTCDCDISVNKGCGCCPDCQCGSEIVDCCENKADKFLDLACEAHHKLLKKKMMDAFEAKIGAKMTKVANLCVDTALVYMKEHMKDIDDKQQFEEKLMEIFKK